MSDGESSEKLSVYNEGVLQIQRINYALSQCNYYASKGQYPEWRAMLDVFWRELCFDIVKKNNGKSFKEFEDCVDVTDLKDLNKKINLSFKVKNTPLIYNLLNEKEIRLRILQHQVGKGGKYADPKDDEMED